MNKEENKIILLLFCHLAEGWVGCHVAGCQTGVSGEVAPLPVRLQKETRRIGKRERGMAGGRREERGGGIMK